MGKKFFDPDGERLVLILGPRKKKGKNYDGMFHIRNLTPRKAEQIVNAMFGRTVNYGMYSSFR